MTISEKLLPLAMPIADLKLDPQNARQHDERGIASIKASLERFGQLKPIVVQEDGMIVRAGNATVLAARELGWTEIAANVKSMTDGEAQAYAIADNRTAELATWDDQVLLDTIQRLKDDPTIDEVVTGFSDDEFAEIVARLNPPEIVEDEVPDPPDDPITKPGDLWLLGDHRVLCGDSTKGEDVERLLDGQLASGLVTDPPYSSGGFTRADRSLPVATKYVQSGTKIKRPDFAGDNRDQRAWTAWVERWMSLYLRSVQESSPCAIWTDWRQLPALTDAIQGGGWLWRGIAVWDKTEGARPIYGRFRPQCEYLVWGSAGKLAINDGRPCYPGVCRCSVDAAKEHITQKPVEAVAWSMSMTIDKAIVLDPFLGSGTTVIAAEQLKRRCYGLEIEPRYVDVIVNRWEKLTGRKAELKA